MSDSKITIDLLMGHTHEELDRAFDLVKDPENWKMPIDAVIPATEDRKMITDAVIFFAGCIPEFKDNGDGTQTVTADGYYMSVGS